MVNLTDVDWSVIPSPEDDGAANHLSGMKIPSVLLDSTSGKRVDLAAQSGLAVVYAYPMTGTPGVALPDGWDMLPGARGCTPQSCSFRDHAKELAARGVDKVYGVSTQTTADQQEAAARLELPFELLSDSDHALADSLQLPTFEVEGKRLLKRLTLVLRDTEVVQVFYPVFPPDANAAEVLNWLA